MDSKLHQRPVGNAAANGLATAPQAEPAFYAWLPTLGLIFLTINSVMAIYRSIDEPWTVAFVVSSYVNLLLLFWCLRAFEKAPAGSFTRDRIKVAVWVLASTLVVMFSHRVAGTMPMPVAVTVWLMAALTTVGSFYALVVYKDDKNASRI